MRWQRWETKTQQIQRYERDHYRRASLATLMKIAAAILASRARREGQDERLAQ